jgi:hypothetical protein
MDIDADSEEELVLRNRDTFAVITPGYGGRIVYLFHRLPDGGVLVIGNPTDHWNFQEALNRYMDQPPNHPGALADVGFEHDPYEVSALVSAPDYAFLQLVNVGDSAMAGARKSFLLPASASGLIVRYELPDAVERHATEACLSPDYHRLLRRGRRHLRACGGRHWKGFRNGEAWVWLALAPDDETEWAEPASPEAGHGVNVRVEAHAPRFDLLLGCGQTNDQRACSLLELGRPAIDEQIAMSSKLSVVGEKSSVDYVLSGSEGARGNPETSASGSR